MSVERIEVSKNTAGHTRAAELVTRAGRLERQLATYFTEIGEVAEALRGEGSEWVGPILPAMLEAAHRIWTAAGAGPAELEAELELERIGEIPLMRLEPDPTALLMAAKTRDLLTP